MRRNCQVLVGCKVVWKVRKEIESVHLATSCLFPNVIRVVINNHDTVKSEAKLVMLYTNYNDSTVKKP